MSDEYEKKHTMIRWHGLRQWKKDDVVGMRGYPDNELNQRYELSWRNGQWVCDYFVRDNDGEIGYDPVYEKIAEHADLFYVIQKAEEHAFKVEHDWLNDFSEWED